MTQLITDRTLPRPRTAEKPITNKSLHQYCSSSTRGSSSSRRHSSVLIHHMITLTQLSLTRDNSTRQTLYIAHNVIPVCDSSTPATSHQAHLMHAHTHTHTHTILTAIFHPFWLLSWLHSLRHHTAFHEYQQKPYVQHLNSTASVHQKITSYNEMMLKVFSKLTSQTPLHTVL